MCNSCLFASLHIAWLAQARSAGHANTFSFRLPRVFFLVSNYSACFLHSAFNVYGAVMIAKAIPTVRPQLLHNNNLEHLNTDNSVKFKKKL